MRPIAQSKIIQEDLEEELERLKKRLCISYELKVVWDPNSNGGLSGEVKGETILIYDEDAREALKTLRHEFLDYSISKIIEPYKEVANKLILLINEEVYNRKEKLVDKLSEIL